MRDYYYGVGLYDATTGAAINSSLISSYCNSIAVSGNNLYVGNYNGVGLYDATTGAAINSSLISGHSQSLAVSGVPEPSTYALLGVGAIGMLVVIRRKKTA
ncbi:MAG: PEP-CTERM sorting domain-containing protein [Candidatus Taylorbacteria bacterium]